MPGKVWHEITYPSPNYNGATVDVWERVHDATLNNGCNYLSMMGLKLIHVSKIDPSGPFY